MRMPRTPRGLLGLTLTKRQDAQMAGIPHHAAGQLVNRLLAAGRKVAICDQQERLVPANWCGAP